MRCLHCGSTLSAFKKLTDSDFCSAEHRDSFYSDQQRLILERLRMSAARFHRLRRTGTVDAVAAAAALNPKIEEAQAPAKLAAFLYAKLEAQQRSGSLQYCHPEFAQTAVPFNRRRPSKSDVNSGLFSSLIPDLPWPCYNPGFRNFADFIQAELAGAIEYGSKFELRGVLRSAINSCGLLPAPEPASADIAFKRAFPLRMAKPKPLLSMDRIRLAVGPTRFVLQGLGYRLVDLRAIELPLPEAMLDASPIEVVSRLGIPASLRLRSVPGTRGVAFLDRIYRMRPRTGVLSQDTTSMRSIPLELLSAVETPACPSSSTALHSPLSTPARELALSASGRPFRLTVRSVPGTAPSGQTDEISALSEIDFAGNPALPETALSQQFAPVALDRFFRPRPRGPVADDALTPMHSAAPEPDGFVSQIADPPVSAGCKSLSPQQHGDLVAGCLGNPVAGPSASATANHAAILPSASPAVKPSFVPEFSACEPEIQNRFFRGRPRGPVMRNVAEFNLLLATAEALVPRPSFCDLPKASPAFEPPLSARMFRMRPKSGVMSADLAGLIPGSEPEQLLSKPATPHPAGVTDFAPSLVTRMFRMRPKAGVDAATASILSSGVVTVSRSAEAAFPSVEVHAPDHQPKQSDRIIPTQSLGPVGRGTARSAQDSSAIAAIGSLKPAVIGLQSRGVGDFAPPMITRLFRGRLRGGVISDRVAAYSLVVTTAEPLLSAPATVSMNLADCTPAELLRLFRFRPKVGVNAATGFMDGSISALPFLPQPPEFVPDWWDVISGAKPIFMNRMFRMRFKNPAQDNETLSQTIRTKHLPVPDPEPVLASFPKNSVVAAPSFLDRLYRMRPKSGKVTPPNANAIPCNALEPRPGAGVPSAVLQSVSRHWKATPLSIKTIAATIPLLLIIALFPLGIPSQAAADPLRQAIARRAAIEHTDNFVGELDHWQGVSNWKRVASGGVQPVGLGLFKPSMEMRNYVVEFSAQIQKGGVGVVVRAADERNYQAVRLVTLRSGPLPTVAIVRYAVIEGKETKRQQTLLPMTVAADTVYRVSLDVNDQSFTLMVQGKVVDFWSEEQLRAGGAGFFGAKGERAWVQNLRMFHQNDAIGKLFAALALQNVQASDGSQVDDESEEP